MSADQSKVCFMSFWYEKGQIWDRFRDGYQRVPKNEDSFFGLFCFSLYLVPPFGNVVSALALNVRLGEHFNARVSLARHGNDRKMTVLVVYGNHTSRGFLFHKV